MGLYFLKVKREAFWNSKHSVSPSCRALGGTGICTGHRSRCLWGGCTEGTEPPQLPGELCLSQGCPFPLEQICGVSVLPWSPSEPSAGSPSATPGQGRLALSETAARAPRCLSKFGFKADLYFRHFSNLLVLN